MYVCQRVRNTDRTHEGKAQCQVKLEGFAWVNKEGWGGGGGSSSALPTKTEVCAVKDDATQQLGLNGNEGLKVIDTK
jgi:hypothetical protein